MTIRARIRGHDFDLMHLAESFPVKDGTGIGLDDDGHYLTTPGLETSSAGGHLMRVAQELLTKLNGLARLTMPNHELVELTGNFFDDTNRSHHAVVASVATVRGRTSIATAVVSGATAEAVEPEAQRQLRIARSVPEVAEALHLLAAAPAPTFVELYKIYEVIRDHPAGAAIAEKEHAIDGVTVEAFKQSANHQGVSGPDARHARMPGIPSERLPRKDLPAARSFIGRMVALWIEACETTKS